MATERDVVAAGYDAIAHKYLTWAERIEGDPRDRFIQDFSAELPSGARVLDLGCGPGMRSTRQLAEKFEVQGVDISEEQIRRARRRVPTATFVRADFSTLDVGDASLDGIVALYAITHVRRAEHGELIRRFARWLRPGGVLLATVGAGELSDRVEDWAWH